MFTTSGKNFEIAFDARKKHGKIELLGYGLLSDIIKVLVRPYADSCWFETNPPTGNKDVFMALLAEKNPKTVYFKAGAAGSLIYQGLEFENMADSKAGDIDVITATLNGTKVVISPTLKGNKDWIFDEE
ncbi:hypothetical protein FACS189428_6050 [Clostridia bacterium]|nr:hypothetical protein FACS189428_6050 [Clostridia bacterium]